MTEELDDDLRDLLDQLEEEDVPEEPPAPEKEVVVEEVEPLETPPSTHALPEAPVDIRVIDGDTPQLIGPEDQSQEPVVELIDLSAEKERLDTVTDEVLDSCRADRQEAQDVIKLCRDEISAATSKSNSPSRMYVDGLVKAVEVKSKIMETAVKMMDTRAKFVSSVKTTIGQQNNVQINASSQELENILQQDFEDDDV